MLGRVLKLLGRLFGGAVKDGLLKLLGSLLGAIVTITLGAPITVVFELFGAAFSELM